MITTTNLSVEARQLQTASELDEAVVARDVIDSLAGVSSEFRELSRQLDRQLICLHLWDHGSLPHFAGGGKQAWVLK